FGARAARAAVRFVAEHTTLSAQAIQAQADDEQRRIVDRFFHPTAGKETIAGLRVELNKTMEDGAGIFRTEASLRAACDAIRELKLRYQQVGLADHSLSFNTELTSVLELGFLLDAAEAVTFSALARRESRG